MEDAVDALKIAFAVFVFVTAVALLFSLTSQAKDTADYVLYYNDETNFYEYTDSSDENRKVSVLEVISTLYRYYKESISVTVDLGSGNVETFDLADKDKSYTTEEEIKKALGEYINDNLKDLTNATFTEEFVEVPISGIYETGADGTQIILSAGGNKLYVTYTLQ